MTTSWKIYEAAVEEGIIATGGIDRLAVCMQELVNDGLIAFGSKQAGVADRPPGWQRSTATGVAVERRLAASAPRLAGHRGRTADAELYRDQLAREPSAPPVTSANAVAAAGNEAAQPAATRDVFISHASEDKQTVARPLAERLQAVGWSVWLDELELTVGDSLERQINEALARSRFGVVVLSPAFFVKDWPQRELQGSQRAKSRPGTKVVLPVWHAVSRDDVLAFSPVLADKLGVPTSRGMDHVAAEIDRALRVAASRPTQTETSEPVVRGVPTASASGTETEDVDATAAVALGMVLRDKGDLARAEVWLRRAVELGNDHALSMLGMVLRDTGQLDEAEGFLRRAVDQGRREALTPLGLVLHELGRLDEATEVLQRAAEPG